jgi:hypothetical protein
MNSCAMSIDLSKMDLDMKTFQKMMFVYKSIENGWKVKKREGKYIFQKNHGGKKEVFMDDYLEKFIKENMSL